MTQSKYFQAYGLELSEDGETPPRLTVKGEHELAEKIVMLAKRYGVPVVERPELCQTLETLPLDTEIPPELYEAAAAILAELGALKVPTGEDCTP